MIHAYIYIYKHFSVDEYIHIYIYIFYFTAPSLVMKIKGVESWTFSSVAKKDVNAAEDAIVSDYTPARKKTPIHN